MVRSAVVWSLSAVALSSAVAPGATEDAQKAVPPRKGRALGPSLGWESGIRRQAKRGLWQALRGEQPKDFDKFSAFHFCFVAFLGVLLGRLGAVLVNKARGHTAEP